jgi:hypothetical protein
MKNSKKNYTLSRDEGKGSYQGAEWTGGPLMSSEFGLLQKGKVYPLKEETAKNSSGWLPVYIKETKEI